MSEIRVVVWNVEWARAHTKRGREVTRILEDAEPDVVCVTEGYGELLPEEGHLIESEPDYGYRIHPGRRKVLLWSRTGWEGVDEVGSRALPEGRFVEGVTRTPVGAVRVVGVCIPWKDAHVRTGRCDREPWEDHGRYLGSLRSILEKTKSTTTELVIGDFNQRIPRVRTPEEVFRQMLDAFAGFSIATAGELDGAKGLAIDHVGHTRDLEPEDVKVIPAVTEEGLRLSDHFGMIVDLRTNAAARG